jgi:UPF0042 nucleotide-binding protein
VKLFLISGLSGSGKSVALKVLEDSDYYCVDNLPVQLLPALIANLQESGHNLCAVSIDARSGISMHELPHYIDQLKQNGVDVHLLFLDAQTDTLVKRFSETRRRHPLSDDKMTLPECVQREREFLTEIGSIGHRIDTSDISANTLRFWVKDFVQVDRSKLTLLFQSFGFKYGIPLDSDLVFDVRCLPNPHYNEKLRPLTGQDEAVIEFLENIERVEKMCLDIRTFIAHWLPCYIADNRNYLTVAIGCTGGQHRSVYLVEKLAKHFQAEQQIIVRHRELSQHT